MPNPKVDVSIIIINYNTYELTSKCIASVLAHTKDVNYEIILIDNASQECDAQLFLTQFPSIRLIKSPQNVGFSKGNNLGIAVAQGEYILLLNSDTELIENSIKICIERMQAEEKIGVLSCSLIYPNGEYQSIANRFPSIQLELIELLRINKLLSASQRSHQLMGRYIQHHRESYVDWVWGAFFLTKRRIIEQFPENKLPDDFFMYFEDVEWCYLIRKMGYKVLYYPKTKIIHHLSASTASLPDSYFAKLEKIATNEATFFKRQKGTWYVKLLYWLRSLKYWSLRGDNFKKVSKFYYNFLKKI
ncbi:MAG: glycosyltransferase family 2 protein [Microscillaceae bacterium]|nr:glycosyltransferase family 2 protein [Microscillaceae bacterium]MDW8460589.1 glycosyltransferase family 2 protein [Cytophagales bacterium]